METYQFIIAILGSSSVTLFLKYLFERGKTKAIAERIARDTTEKMNEAVMHRMNELVERLDRRNKWLREQVDIQDLKLQEMQDQLGVTKELLFEEQAARREDVRRISQLESELEELRQENQVLKGRIASLRSQEILSETQVESLKREIQELRARIQELEQENKSLRNSLLYERRKRVALEKRVQSGEEQVQDLQETVEDSTDEPLT